MNEMQKFREVARERGLCDRYSRLWDSCTSNKQLLDLAMDSNGIPYLCESVSQGWGLPVDYLLARFRMYINNKYISLHKGYSSKLFIRHYDNVWVDATNVVLIECSTVLVVPKNTICNIYLVNSRVNAVGDGTCYVRRYGRSSFKPEKTINYIKL